MNVKDALNAMKNARRLVAEGQPDAIEFNGTDVVYRYGDRCLNVFSIMPSQAIDDFRAIGMDLHDYITASGHTIDVVRII